MSNARLIALAALLSTAALYPALAAEDIPDFASGDLAWAADSFDLLPPVNGGKGPVMLANPKYPFCRNGQGCTVQPRMASTDSPFVQPWVQEISNKWNEDILKGKQAFAQQSRCWPGNVPVLMTYTAEPQYYMQLPKNEFMIIYERGNNIRHIWMNAEHAKNPTPSWTGDSVGHYEGQTLVIDTIGIKQHMYSFVDNYRTTHTDKLHVVERYTMKPDKSSMLGEVHVEDPGAYTMPWDASQKLNPRRLPIANGEYVCAENNDANYFGEDEVPIPQTKTPDF